MAGPSLNAKLEHQDFLRRRKANYRAKIRDLDEAAVDTRPRTEQSAEIASHVDEFLRRGGVIEQVPEGAAVNTPYRY